MDRLLAERASRRHSERLHRLKILSIGTIIGALLGALWFGQSAADEHGVKVVAIGTGDGVSTLITAGHQRILVVAGNDRDALASVLTSSLRWNQRTLDLAIIASDADDEAIRVAVRELDV